MKKVKRFVVVMTAGILAACSSETYVGEPEATAKDNASLAIGFSAGSDRASRADLTGEAAALALNNRFTVYGVKTTGTTDAVVYPSYFVAYDGTEGAQAAGSTESNVRGWEYVGLTSHPEQTLHFWDYGTDSYTFQAWSASTGNAAVTVNSKDQLTVVTTSAADLAKLYIADLVKVLKSTSTSGVNTYGGVVTFTFRNMSAKVRLGFYETIPGYTVSKMKFRSAASRFTDTQTEVKLDGSFNAGDGTTGGTYRVTYNATTQRAELDNTATAVPATFYNFGSFTTAAISKEAANPTWAGGSAAFQNVLPNEDNNGDMTLYVDFTLTPEDGSEDIISVKGAHVTVPAAAMVWHPNFAYTYIFKITKDVNGTTGTEGTDPDKLYPITFDAIVAEFDESTATCETEVK